MRTISYTSPSGSSMMLGIACTPRCTRRTGGGSSRFVRLRAVKPTLTVAQSARPVGDTVVPLVFMSDATHLTNFAGNKKAWPVYMTISNLPAAVRMRPAMQAVVLAALLPVPIKLLDVAAPQRADQRTHKHHVTQYVLRHLLAPLCHPEGGVFTALCADANRRRCYTPVSASVADYPEHYDLQNLRHSSCIWCECPADEMGDHRPPQDHHPARDHGRYAA
jgi:hypothetical protein